MTEFPSHGSEEGKRPRRYWRALLLFAIAGLLLPGCSRHGPISYLKDWLGPPRAEIAVKALSAADPDVRRENLVVMSERPWGMSDAALRGYALVARTPTEEPTVRSVAVRALGLAGDKARPHIEDILVALGDAEEYLRWDAAVALDSVHGDAAVEPLCLRAVHDRSVDVRIACARALRNYPNADSATALTDAMGDTDFAVRWRAHQSLVEIAGEDMGPDPADWKTVAREIAPVEQASGEPAGESSVGHL